MLPLMASTTARNVLWCGSSSGFHPDDPPASGPVFGKGWQSLPSQLIDPTLQIAHHGSLIAVGPQALQAFLEKVKFS